MGLGQTSLRPVQVPLRFSAQSATWRFVLESPDMLNCLRLQPSVSQWSQLPQTCFRESLELPTSRRGHSKGCDQSLLAQNLRRSRAVVASTKFRVSPLCRRSSTSLRLASQDTDSPWIRPCSQRWGRKGFRLVLGGVS